MTPKEVLAFAKKNDAMVVDFKFMDFIGLWQHFSVPIAELGESDFEAGYGFDGSSIRGWQPIHASDMLIIPDPVTAVMEPFTAVPTLTMLCNIVDPVTKEKYTRDPRNIAQKAEEYLKFTGIGDMAWFGPEAEFFIFDDIRFDSSYNYSYYLRRFRRRSVEHRKSREPEPRIQAPIQRGLFPCASDGYAAGHPYRDDPDHGKDRRAHGMPSPRGRHCRSG